MTDGITDWSRKKEAHADDVYEIVFADKNNALDDVDVYDKDEALDLAQTMLSDGYDVKAVNHYHAGQWIQQLMDDRDVETRTLDRAIAATT